MDEEKRISRRKFLKATGGALTISILSACTANTGPGPGGPTAQTTSGPMPAGNTPTPQITAGPMPVGGTPTAGATAAGMPTEVATAAATAGETATAVGADGTPVLENQLNFYNWSDYVAESTIPDFQKRFGVKVIQDFYSSNEDMIAKLQAGGNQYDVVVPSDYAVSIMIESDLLMKLDMSRIPNFQNIGKDFRGLPFDPRNEYSVPYQWGTTGILYDPEQVEEEVTGWEALWNPDYKGRIGMLNDVRETPGAALKLLGYSLNTTDPKQLQQMKQKLLEQKPLLRGYFDSTRARDLVVNGDLALTHIFSGDAFLAFEENEDLVYVIPRQGATVWTDNLAIPKGAPHPNLAHAFINYILEPKVGAEISNYTYYATPNQAALPLIDKEARTDPAIYPPPAVFNRLEAIRDVGRATRTYERIFTEVKSA